LHDGRGTLGSGRDIDLEKVGHVRLVVLVCIALALVRADTPVIFEFRAVLVRSQGADTLGLWIELGLAL
jgi:hypothetical protein